MEKVTIQLDAKWVKIARSPLYMVVGALQGIAVSFAPLFLYWCGKGYFYKCAEWIVVPLCFATILLVSFFYFWLGAAVMKELRKER
ncbi:MAG TPA: hypothetical protein VMV72_01585 [Verrucomicrobiae bacterium]|nr:hypothetical protein [Verrucomicrobiae bacterium]